MKNELTQLRRSNLARRKACHEDDWDFIRQIEYRLAMPLINEFERQVIVQDLLDMAQDARTKDKSLEEALGMTDVEFCKNIAQTCQPTDWRERVLNNLHSLCSWTAMFWLLKSIFWLLDYADLLACQQRWEESLGLQGKWVMLLPTAHAWAMGIQWLLAFGAIKLMESKWMADSILRLLICFAMAIANSTNHLIAPIEQALADRTFRLEIWLPPTMIAVVIVWMVSYYFYRRYIHQLSLQYNWRRDGVEQEEADYVGN